MSVNLGFGLVFDFGDFAGALAFVALWAIASALAEGF